MSIARSLPASDVLRARMILMLAEGRSYVEIQERLQTTAPTISRWRKRFLEDGLNGLLDLPGRGQKPTVITPKLQARVLAATRNKPNDGSTHWSVRKLARQLKISKDAVHRIWRKAGVKPHRLERYMVSDDPDFETKAADIIGLYLNPPQHAAVFCVDEKSAIQALDRLDPVLRFHPAGLRGMGLNITVMARYRYAALDVKSGKVHGKTAARHTSQEFVDFLGQVVHLCKPKQEIHIIVDNLSAHKTKQVTEFLDSHPEVKLHFTPTYSSWLNQVEIWFSKIERDVIARGVFTSVGDLARKLMRYIRAYSRNATPFQWKYSDTKRRIHPC